MRFATLLILSAGALCAESVSEPATLGYVAGGAHLRRIVGTAGAARQLIADAVPEGTVVHPARGTVLSSAGERLAISERGDAVVVQRENSLRVIAATAEQEQIREMEAPQEIRALAVSNGGDNVAIATGAGVRVLGTSEREYPDITSSSALAFAGGDLLVADADRALVWRIGESREIAATDLPDVSAIAADGARLVLARADGTVHVRNTADGTEQVLECRCKPVRLVRLAAPGLWLLTDGGTEPLWMLDLSDTTEARIWFVPAFVGSEDAQ